MIRVPALIPFALAIAIAIPAVTHVAVGETSPDFVALEAAENAANAKPGPRTVPGRAIPVPGTASPELQATIAAPYRIPAWNANPKSAEEWKELINRLAAGAAANQ